MADAHQVQGAQLFIGQSGSPTVFLQVAGFQSFSGPDGKATVIDKTDLDSAAKEKLMGLPDEGNISFDCNFISADAGQLECDNARTTRTRRQFKLTIPASAQAPATNVARSIYFWGYVLGLTLSGGVDAIVKSKIDVTIDGPKTVV